MSGLPLLPRFPVWYGPVYGSILAITLLSIAARRVGAAGTIGFTGIAVSLIAPSVAIASAVMRVRTQLAMYARRLDDTSLMRRIVTQAWNATAIGWACALAVLIVTFVLVLRRKTEVPRRASSVAIVFSGLGIVISSLFPDSLFGVADAFVIDIHFNYIDKKMVYGELGTIVFAGFTIAIAAAGLAVFVSVAGKFARASRLATVIVVAIAALFASLGVLRGL